MLKDAQFHSWSTQYIKNADNFSSIMLKTMKYNTMLVRIWGTRHSHTRWWGSKFMSLKSRQFGSIFYNPNCKHPVTQYVTQTYPTGIFSQLRRCLHKDIVAMFVIEKQAKKIIITNEHHQRMDSKFGYIYKVKCCTAIIKTR